MNVQPRMKHVALGEIAEFINGAAFKPADWTGEGRRIIRIQNLNDPSKPFNRTTAALPKKFEVHPGTLLVSWSASLGVFEWNEPDVGLLNQHIFKVVPDVQRVTQGYLRHMLENALLDMARHHRGSTMVHVNRGEFLGTTIPLPPLEEQKRIAAILDQADALRRLRRRALDRLNTLGQAIFYEMFGNGVGLARVPIAAFAEVKGGKRLPKGADYSEHPTRHPYIRVSNLDRLRIDTTEIKYITEEVHAAVRRYTVQLGDVVISIAGTIGLTAAVPRELAGANLTENAAKITPKGGSAFDADYLAWALSSADAQSQISARTGQVTIGKLALFRIEQLEVPYPELMLQRAFAARVAEVEARIARQKYAMHVSEQLFTSLQHRAFRGEL